MQVAHRVKVPNIKHPIAIRPRTSDVYTAKMIFGSQDYMLEKSGLPHFLNDNFKPKFIIDGGANVGYASIFFVNRYPAVESILAIEPESKNFEMLQFNTRGYPQIKSIHGALWNHETDLSVTFNGSHQTTDSFITREIGDSSFQARESIHGITIGKIFRESGFPFIDILKLDVEGAEKEIFSEEGNYQEWLPFVKVLIIELHDRMKRDCSHNFFRAVSWYKSFFAFSGENLILIREDLL